MMIVLFELTSCEVTDFAWAGDRFVVTWAVGAYVSSNTTSTAA
jgi:hypothetical protein